MTPGRYGHKSVDNDYSIDIAEVRSTIASADVLVLRFVAVGKRLLLDFRATELDGPLVRVVEPVQSVQERYADLKRLRPRLPVPEKIVAVWWPRFVPSLEETGIWNEVMRRIAEAGHPEAVARAEEAFRELAGLEAQTQRNAITGEGFRTLWSAEARRR